MLMTVLPSVTIWNRISSISEQSLKSYHKQKYSREYERERERVERCGGLNRASSNILSRHARFSTDKVMIMSAGC